MQREIEVICIDEVSLYCSGARGACVEYMYMYCIISSEVLNKCPVRSCFSYLHSLLAQYRIIVLFY